MRCDLGRNVPGATQAKARCTIDALKLNSEGLVEDRAKWASAFGRGAMELPFLKENRPFLAEEIERQGAAHGPVDEASLRLFITGLFRRRGK